MEFRRVLFRSDHLLASAPAMAGAEALIRRCDACAVPMALATSSSRAAVALKAAPHPWLELIRVRVHGDDPDLRKGKPAPDVFLLAAERLGVDPSQCWAFEDSPAGAQAAAAAGTQVHVLLTPATRDAPFPPGVIRIHSLEEMVF